MDQYYHLVPLYPWQHRTYPYAVRGISVLMVAPEALSDAVMINGATLSFGEPVIPLTSPTFTLATSSDGLMTSQLGANSFNLIASATTGESISLNTADTLVSRIGNKGELSVGCLNSAIVGGFKPLQVILTSVSTAAGAGESGTEKSPFDVLGFIGEGERRQGMSVFNVIVPYFITVICIASY